MMVQCNLCGHEFNPEDAQPIECKCGCGGDNVLCPNCGYEVRLRTKIIKPKTDEEMGFFGKLMNALRMG